MSDKTPRIDRIDKNYIINGGCEYFEQALSNNTVDVILAKAVPSSFDYVSMDMFEMETSGTWTAPESSRSVSPVGSKTRRSHLFTGTPTTLSDEFRMRTKIESIFAADLAEKEFSLGLKLKSSNFTQVTITVSYADSEDVFATTTQIAQQTFTFNADSTEQEVVFENIATATNVRNGLQVQYDFKGLGALAATTLSVGEFVLNKGRKKSQYSPAARDQVEEKLLCQRYFEVIQYGTNGVIASAHIRDSSTLDGFLTFKEKRIVPTCSSSTISENGWNFQGVGATTSLANAAIFGAVTKVGANIVHAGVHGAGTNGDGGYFEAGTAGNARIFIDARL